MYIFFDIGGTKSRVVAGNGLKFFGEPVKFETPKDFEKGIKTIVDAAHEVCNGERVTGIAGGVRGILDHEKTMMLSDPVGPCPTGSVNLSRVRSQSDWMVPLYI
jgi:predicted NBD/HSP70 family sugar kinase